MKQILHNSAFGRVVFFCMMSCFFVNLQAQVFFSDNFDDEDISDWTSIDADGDGIPWFPAALGIDGSGSMISYSWNPQTQLPLTPENYITTPAIDLTNAPTATYIGWKAYAQDQQWAAEKYKVVISTGNTIEDIDEGAIIYENTLSANGADVWDEISLKIDEYVGQVIYVTFVHFDVSDQFLITVDDVQVLGLPKRDAGMTGISFTKYHLVGGQSAISGTLQNLGEETINSIVLGYTVNGGTQVTQEFTGLNVPSLGNLSYSFDDILTLDQEIEYDVDVTVVSVNGDEDLNPDNNDVLADMAVLSFRPEKRVVFEEATGTWCGWCPRGAVMLDLISAQYEDAIGIAVHNSDPMEISNYDDEFGNLIGGYPSMLADRLPDNVMPNDLASYSALESTYFSRVTALVPASMDMEVELTSLTPDIGELNIDMNATFAASIEGDFTFSVVLTENGVTGSGDGTNTNNTDYDQVNFYADNARGPMDGYEVLPNPVPATQMVYDHVARELIGSFYGIEESRLTSVERNGTYSHSESILIAKNLIPNYSVVGLLLDNATGEIINAVEVKTITSSTDEVYTEENNVIVAPNPFSGETTITMDLEQAEEVVVTLIDILGRVVSTEDFGQRNGKVVLNYNAATVNPGLYIMNIKAGNNLTSRKVTIN